MEEEEEDSPTDVVSANGVGRSLTTQITNDPCVASVLAAVWAEKDVKV